VSDHIYLQGERPSFSYSELMYAPDPYYLHSSDH